MTETEFIRYERKKMMEGKPWTEEDIKKASDALLKGEDKNQQMRDKVRLWMQIQNEGRKLMKKVGYDIPIVTRP